MARCHVTKNGCRKPPNHVQDVAPADAADVYEAKRLWRNVRSRAIPLEAFEVNAAWHDNHWSRFATNFWQPVNHSLAAMRHRNDAIGSRIHSLLKKLCDAVRNRTRSPHSAVYLLVRIETFVVID